MSAITTMYEDQLAEQAKEIENQQRIIELLKASTYQLEAERDDIKQYVKGIYEFLQSTAPAGFANEAFRLPPNATRAQTALFDALQSDNAKERPGLARQDQADRPGNLQSISLAGAAPAPEGRKITTTRIENHLKKSPLGDISMYRDGFFDGAKWAAAPKDAP